MLGIRHFEGVAIDLWQGDITTFVCDAMVNSANVELAGGGGVGGAIHAAAGPSLMAECCAIGSCSVGQAVVTGAGKLPTQKVIHAVGPRWQGGQHGEAALLRSAYYQSLQQANACSLAHVALPAISTGIYGYPPDKAAEVAMLACQAFLQEHVQTKTLRRITHVLYSGELYEIFQHSLFEVFADQ